MEKAQVLIVEDDGIIAMDLESRMKNFGYFVSGIVNYAEKAIEKVEELNPDLVKQILAFSPQADRELKPLKVQLIIKEVLKLIRATLPSTIEIKQYVSNKCGLVMADFTQIHQVVMWD